MRTAATAFLAAVVCAAVLTPVVRSLAHRHGALDHALTSRKAHARPIPRLGGIAIVLAFYAPLLALLFVDTDVGRRFWANAAHALALIVGGLAIAALGVWDDLRGADAKTKFLVQFAVAAGMYGLGFRIDQIANPWGTPIQLGWLGLPFTMLWIAGVVNAMNLIDGLDGLAGGVALIAIATTFAIATARGDALMVLFTAALAGAVLGFLFYNFNPASIFMGDTGSMFLGFVLATTAIQTNEKSSTAVAIVVPIIALGLPIADTLLAIVRRAARGAPLFSADRGHIHHRLLDLGLTHRQSVVVLYGASVLLGGSALALSFASSQEATWFLLALSVAAFLALRRLGFMTLAGTHKVIQDRRRNLGLRAAIRRIGERVRRARTGAELWRELRAGASMLGASAVALHLADRGLASSAYSEGFDGSAPPPFRARYSIFPERPGETQLELGWSDGRTSVERDVEIAIEILCDHVSAALERIGPDEERSRLAKVVNLRG